MMKPERVAELEAGLAEYLGVNHAIGTSLGRTALLVLLRSMGIQQGDEVIVPAYICEVVPNAVLKSGGAPVFADIDPEDYHISIPHLKSLISEKTRAIIINHTFGYPEDIDGVKDLVRGKNIYLIEDVAQSLGAKYQGRRVGSLGDAAFVSLTKNMFNIGGGTIITNDDSITSQAESILTSTGTNSLTTHLFIGLMSYLESRRVRSGLSNFYFNTTGRFGKKSGALTKSYHGSLKIPESLAMSATEAGLAIPRLCKLDSMNEKRRYHRDFLDSLLKDAENFDILKPVSESSEPVCSWYAIRLKEPSRREEVIKTLAGRGVFLYSFWYPIPIEEMKYNDQTPADVPEAVRTSRATLVFKIDPNLTEKQLKKISEVLLTL